LPTEARGLAGSRRIGIHRVSTKLESKARKVRAVKIGFETAGGGAGLGLSSAGRRGLSSNLATLVPR